MPNAAVQPRYRSVPPYVRTDSDLAVRVAEHVGITLDPEQIMVLDSIFAVDPNGLPACFSVSVTQPRQQGKSLTLAIAALTDLFVFRRPLTVWSAHLFRTSRATFEYMCGLIEASPKFRQQCRAPRTANGSEAIELLDGSARIEFYARSAGSGRGRTGAVVTVDEALFATSAQMAALLPVLATVKGAQVRFASSAGVRTSDVLRDIRDRGRAGSDPTLAYYEWAAEEQPCRQRDCPHLPADEIPGCALDDRALWRQASPSRRVPESTLLKFRHSLEPSDFAREFLGIWEDPEGATGPTIPGAAWAACAAPAEMLEGTVALGLAVSPDQSWSAIAAAGTRATDGVLAVEVVENRPGTGWVPDRLAELTAKWQTYGIALDPAGPAGALLDQLRQRGVRVVEVTGRDRAQSCGEFLAAVKENTLRHPPDPALDMAVRLARSRPAADGFVISARVSSGDVSPLLAAILAAGLHSTNASARYDILQSVW